MARLRSNEWNFAHRVAALFSSILQEPAFEGSTMGHAEPELTELRGARRLDLVIFARDDSRKPLVTGELKLPWTAEGRTPYNASLIDDAHRKASNVGAFYFLTWNVRRVVVWRTDDPGVDLYNRVVSDREVITSPLHSSEDLDAAFVTEALATHSRELLTLLDSLLGGARAVGYLPLDRLFVARLEAALDYPIDATLRAMTNRAAADGHFRRHLERWMRERQNWVVSKATEAENLDLAARLSCYVLVNRLCFYNALRRKFSTLPRIAISSSIRTGPALQGRLDRAFKDAERFTGDYETVFDGDFADTLPFLADDAVPDWRRLIRSLDLYDFATIPLDVIGSMYERLISPEERHRYGQHYTPTWVVDLINAFAIRNANVSALDPACGGGTFLVRAYARRRFLDPSLEHSQLLETILGCDLVSYACHLATINLAIRDLIDEDNFPRIHHGDFLALRPSTIFSEQPVRVRAGGLILEHRPTRIEAGSLDAVIGNPPYINAREMPANLRERYMQDARRLWPDITWRRTSDIYVFFFAHAAQFLKKHGRLVLLTQSGWLDTEYGFALQEWMLSHFRLVAVMESDVEPWFTDARVATSISVLELDPDAANRASSTVSFVQFRRRLADLMEAAGSEDARQHAAESLAERIVLNASGTRDEVDFRVRGICQGDLEARGVSREGKYVGSKWGRYLRSPSTLYKLQSEKGQRFQTLDRAATVRRGVTTNCDQFFIVTDISAAAVASHEARYFRDKFAVSVRDVVDRRYAIVRRGDGFECAMDSVSLRPIMKTARDIGAFSTSRLDLETRLVTLPGHRRRTSRLWAAGSAPATASGSRAPSMSAATRKRPS
jgi:hypothetical protein